MAQLDGFDFGAVGEGFFDNPYPVFRELREMPGPCHQPDGSVFASRYEDVAEILGNHEHYSSDKTIDFKPKFGDGPLYEHHTTSLVFSDPPRHTRVRQLLTPFFTPRTLRALEPGIAAMIDGLIDEAAEKEHIDLVADFAIAVPLTLIGDMLGIPRDEREPLRAWQPPVIARVEEDTLLLDLRTVLPKQEDILIAAIRSFAVS